MSQGRLDKELGLPDLQLGASIEGYLRNNPIVTLEEIAIKLNITKEKVLRDWYAYMKERNKND